MSEMAIGARIGAVVYERPDGVIEFLGYGVYDGDFEIGPEAIGDGSQYARDTSRKVPRLTLDNGEVVWGSEVWWGAEEDVQRYLKDSTVQLVFMKDLRAEYVKDHDGS